MAEELLVEVFTKAFGKAMEDNGIWLENNGRKAPGLYQKHLQVSAFNAIILGMHAAQNGYGHMLRQHMSSSVTEWEIKSIAETKVLGVLGYKHRSQKPQSQDRKDSARKHGCSTSGGTVHHGVRESQGR